MSTPTPAPDHPAYQLSRLLPGDLRLQLAKTPYRLPLEADIYQARLKELRDDWKYAYVVQWCYLFKNMIKLTEHFDVDSFEEELLQLNPPAFITKLKVQLVHFLIGIKISDSYVEDTGEFEDVLKDLLPQFLLDKFPTDDDLEHFKFFTLSVPEQIDVYYQLIELANAKSEALRKLVDNRYDKQLEILRPRTVAVNDKKFTTEEYLIMPDLRLYFKEIKFGKLELPKKRKELEEKLASVSLETLFDRAAPKITKFKCVATNVYEYDSFVNSQPKNSALFKSLKTFYEEIAENDIRRRKQELSRQRQIKLQSLMVHRKRSSRLEEKEKKKAEEDEKERLDLERYRREAAAIRAAKRMKLRGDGNFSSREGSVDVNSREERYRRKHQDFEQSPAAAEADTSNTEPQAADVQDPETSEPVPVPVPEPEPVAPVAPEPEVAAPADAVEDKPETGPEPVPEPVPPPAPVS